ncbi:MAG: biopolymer transporter ExbD [Candidatus Cloacimonas sp.]|jgi:biopolymer transport protein ExbD|nr:biopolymer transporter ExbD [Candidatus Cloacimonadota bacterium]
MKIRRKKKVLGEIPTSSTSDIAFLLLVFFLTTTKFDVKQGLGLVLPPPSQESAKRVRLQEDNIVRVLVNRDGRVALDEEELSYHELENRIRVMVRENPDLVISLRTDRQSRYRYMVEALDRLRSAGAEKISLSTN